MSFPCSAETKETQKLPEPENITEDFYHKCTCDVYEWIAHSCPLAEEIGENYDEEYYTCCPYCERECGWNV